MQAFSQEELVRDYLMWNNKMKQPLSDTEYTLIWMSILYAVSGHTIASATLPYMIIGSYWDRLSDGQKQTLYTDIDEEIKKAENLDEEWLEKYSYDGKIWRCDESWYQFRALLDKTNRCKVHTLYQGEESDIDCFKYDDEYVPIERWVDYPFIKTYIEKKYIKKVEEIK